MVFVGALSNACEATRMLCQLFDTDLIAAGDAERLLDPVLRLKSQARSDLSGERRTAASDIRKQRVNKAGVDLD